MAVLVLFLPTSRPTILIKQKGRTARAVPLHGAEVSNPRGAKPIRPVGFKRRDIVIASKRVLI